MLVCLGLAGLVEAGVKLAMHDGLRCVSLRQIFH